MGGLWHLGLAVAIFLASHSLTNRPAFRARAEAVLGGKTGFTIAYSLLSLALLAWIIAAYAAAPTLLLWGQAPWMRWVPVLAMVPACLLLVGGLSTPNPFSIGPGGRGFDPAHPGLLRLTRHPMLWGLALWAGAHIIPNGDVAAVMVFAPLLLLALAGPTVLDRKRRRSVPDWECLAAATGRPSRAMLREIGPWRVIFALLAYKALLLAHEPVIGISPLP
jgi:uncharacterized membrane protein